MVRLADPYERSEALGSRKKLDVKFVKMNGFETIKPNTFPSGLKGIDDFVLPFMVVRTWNLY